jgi:FixJ family two-component response regulator
MVELNPTVFVIDDDASVLKSLSRLLRSSGLEARTFESAEQFLEQNHYEGVGCIVLDVEMPGLSGTALQDRLNASGLSMPVIFITGHGNISMGVGAMKKGAVDFLTKPFDDDVLLGAVKKAIETDARTKAERLEARETLRHLGQLTPRELEVLRCVISGMPNKRIAFKLKIAEKTVKIHRGHIMKKLDAASVAELVRTASRAGIEPILNSI